MNIQKVLKFLKMNRYEKRLSLVRNSYCFLHKHEFASIGKKSYFLNPIFLSGTKYIHMGEDVGFWDHARIEAIDSWKDQTFTPSLRIGNHVNIGQDCHMTLAEKIVIEDGVVCTARVMITDIHHVTEDLTLPVMEQGLITKPVRICEGAFVGLGAMIMPGVTVGKHAIVGAGAIVTKDVPDYATVVGAPARIVKQLQPPSEE